MKICFKISCKISILYNKPKISFINIVLVIVGTHKNKHNIYYKINGYLNNVLFMGMISYDLVVTIKTN